MSRVTIGNLLNDYEDDKIDIITGAQAYDIEVVPRKIVEMIIEHYDRIIDDSEKQIAYFHEDSDAFHAATVRKSCVGMLKAYAETLLKQFEEEV